MNLWIRSQDKKRLIQVNDLRLETFSIVGFSFTDTKIHLGTYKSEVRALGVLDKIQSKLLDNVIATNDAGYATLLENTCVYEMPQE